MEQLQEETKHAAPGKYGLDAMFAPNSVAVIAGA